MSYNVTKAEASPEKFQTFEDLEVYKAAREFRKAMYVVTRRLPDFEKYDLASQIRRASEVVLLRSRNPTVKTQTARTRTRWKICRCNLVTILTL